MRRTAALLPVLALGLGLGCARRVSGGVEGGPVVIYMAQTVRTLDPGQPVVEAVAVERGKVAALGTALQLSRLYPDAAKVDLGAATVVPGLSDAHGHLELLGKSLNTLDLGGAGTVGEVLDRLGGARPQTFQGDFLVAQGWDQNRWPAGPDGQKPFPDRTRLDALFPDTPVLLWRVDWHAAWVNQEALRRARITRATPDPRGGRIVRDEDGEPTGVLVDKAVELVSAILPKPTTEQREARLWAALLRCAEVGLTSVHDAGMELEAFRVLQQWDIADRLPLRVYAMGYGTPQDLDLLLDQGPYQGRKLTMRAVKFFLDGALGSRGAALHQPYTDEPSGSGLLLLTEPELEEKATAFMARGFQVAVHAIGDKANSLALDVLGRAQAQSGKGPGRNRLEHAQVLRAQDFSRLSTLGVVVSMQPVHATSDMGWAEARLGPERMVGAYAWKSVLEAGAPLAFGSDFPVERPDPLLGLYAARTRQEVGSHFKEGWYPAQRLSGEQALQAFTTGPAYAAFAEAERGTLSPGSQADLVALSVDPVDGPAEALPKARILLTVMGGEVTFKGR